MNELKCYLFGLFLVTGISTHNEKGKYFLYEYTDTDKDCFCAMGNMMIYTAEKV